MRIICGAHKGKKIKAPEALPVRPTTDMAKESLFNILNNYFYFDQIRVLDLCAGTGNVSYEFAARGALEVWALDNHPQCVQFIQKTANDLNFNNIHTIRADVLAFLGQCTQKFNVIFADPPYRWENHAQIPALVFERNLLLPDGFLVMEHPADIRFDEHPKFYQRRVYGRVNFSIFAENL
ncbi:MAG: RsmD family RNA methyltransferase [Bacteroidales bacterium]|nr:RsmD family RNA methyltransferase [Bacteroidales bacterium]